MPARNPPSWLQGGSHSAENDRQVLVALARERGVLASGDLAVSQNATPNMGVSIAAGSAFVMGTESTLQGLYHAWSDGAVSITIAPSDPTNPRRDLVVARVRDLAYLGGAPNTWALEVVQGTAAATPAAPAVPASSLVLAEVAVAAAATSITSDNITDLRPPAPIPGRRIAEHVLTAAGTSSYVNPHDTGLTTTFVMPYLAPGQNLVVEASGYYYAFGVANASNHGLYTLISRADNTYIGSGFAWNVAGVNSALMPRARGVIDNATAGFAAGTRVTVKVRTQQAGADVGNAWYVVAAADSPAILSVTVS